MYESDDRIDRNKFIWLMRLHNWLRLQRFIIGTEKRQNDGDNAKRWKNSLEVSLTCGGCRCCCCTCCIRNFRWKWVRSADARKSQSTSSQSNSIHNNCFHFFVFMLRDQPHTCFHFHKTHMLCTRTHTSETK